MQPFYQGQLDVFCALYAVLNALHLTHGIGVGQARRIFNETLEEIARDPDLMHVTLHNETDYVWLVERLLTRYGVAEGAPFPLSAQRPFAVEATPTPRLLWSTLERWLHAGARRTVVFRFHRYLPFRGDPIVQHWSTIDRMESGTLLLHDSSHESNAVRDIPREGFATAREGVCGGCLLLIEAPTVWLLEGRG